MNIHHTSSPFRGQMLTGKGALKGNVFVGNGATLAPGNSIGTLAFNNNLTLNGGSTTLMALGKSPVTNDVALVAGSLAYGGTLVLTNLSGSPLVSGDSFKLFSAADYSGAFTNILPAIPGLNLAWSTNGLTNGILRVVAALTVPPKFVAVIAGGGGLVFSGTNGVPGGNYFVLTSSNLFLPLNQWPRLVTNVFDDYGGLRFTNNLDANLPQQYYLLQLQ